MLVETSSLPPISAVNNKNTYAYATTSTEL